MTYKIEKGVPLEKAKQGRPDKYPFAQMEVGDSILFPATEGDRVRSAASHAGRRNGKKFASRNTDEGLRIWRIK